MIDYDQKIDAKLKELGLTRNVINYAVLSAYFAGHEGLNKEIDRLERVGRKLDSTLMVSLHQKFLDSKSEYLSYGNKVNSIISTVSKNIDRAGAMQDGVHAAIQNQGNEIINILAELKKGAPLAKLTQAIEIARKENKSLKAELEKARQEIQELSRKISESTEKRDEITHFMQWGQFEYEWAQKIEQFQGLLWVSLDNFKEFSLKYGPETTESLTQKVAGIIRAVFPNNTPIARYSDSDYMVAVPMAAEYPVLDLREYAELLGKRIYNFELIRRKDKQKLERVTASCITITFEGSGDLDALMAEAAKCLSFPGADRVLHTHYSRDSNQS